MSRFAVIPARGGSKRIQKKNTRLFCGRPIIAYSIEVALVSELFDEVFVTTEDQDIAKLSEGLGAKVIARPLELADDFTPTIPVMRHAIGVIEDSEKSIDAICCIYPASPFITPDELIEGLGVLDKHGSSFVFTAACSASPIERMFRINSDDSIKMIDPESYNIRTQDLEPAYFDADRFYWGTPASWMTNERVFLETARAVIVSPDRVCVIDTEDDWLAAEALYRAVEIKKRAEPTSVTSIEHGLSVIDEIEKVRSRNNVNWMDILRLAFRHAPTEARGILRAIHTDDSQISRLLNKLT